jgi:hypothetical protein
MSKKYLGLIIAIFTVVPTSLFAEPAQQYPYKDYPSPSSPSPTSDQVTYPQGDSATSYRTSVSLRPPAATGLSAGIYGGAIAFQDGTLHITSTSFPGAEIKGNTKSELGGVAGVRIEETWPSFAAIGGDPTQAKPSVLMPAMGIDFFWTGYRYKAVDATFGTGSSLQSDVNTFTFMYTPKLKFNLGAWRPYVGLGVGGTYVNAGNVQITIPGVGSGGLSGSGDDFDFSASAMAGFEVFVDPHWSLSFDYKYLYILDPTFHGNISGVPIQYKIDGLNNSLFTAGLNFYF